MWRVEEVFRKRGTAVPVSLTRYSAKELIGQFDEPHKLTVITDALGGVNICLKRDREHHRKRQEIVLQVLRERGIQKGNLGQIGLQGALELRAIITQRMKEE